MDQDDRDDLEAQDDSEAVRLPLEPFLDLHSFKPADIPSLVDEYLTAAHAAGLREAVKIENRFERQPDSFRIDSFGIVLVHGDDQPW